MTSTDRSDARPAPDSVAPEPSTATSPRRWLVPAGLALATVGLLAGLLLGRGMSGSAPVTDEVSVGFLRDMTTHHAQAVEMSEIVHRRSADPELNYLAWDILTTQQGQIGIMTGWLDLSEQSASATGPAMAWMGHSGPMPGMASREQLEELDRLPLGELETRFLQLMVDHHLGAVGMARYAAEHAEHREVAVLAEKMDTGQAAEIAAMRDLLQARGAGATTDGSGSGGSGHDGH